MKKILIVILLLTSYFVSGQVKLIQLQPCKVGGVLEDSCFVMTGADGLLKFISLSQLKSISGGGTLVANGDGSYTFSGDNTQDIKYTCSVVNDTTIRLYDSEGNLASTCNITGMGALLKTVSINSDTTLTFTTKSGGMYTVQMCPFVRACETVTSLTYNTTTNILTYNDEDGTPNNINLNEATITNNVNGSYTHLNEVGTSTIFGYKLNCVNDSTITLTDQDGTVVSTCQIQGGTGTGETITNLYNNSNGSYTYTNELGVDTLFGFHLDGSNVPTNGKIYFTDLDGTRIDSVNICYNCPALSNYAINDTFTITSCTTYNGVVYANDTLCDEGLTEYSVVNGTEVNVLISMDASGKFIATFTDCSSSVTHKFSYRMKCIDGTVSYAEVFLDFPGCGGATANLDMYSGQKGSHISFGVAPNDVACAAPKVSTYKIIKGTVSGSIFINDNGIGIYNPLPPFVGTDSAIIGVYCNNVLCDTSFIKFTIFNGNTADDYYSLCAGSTKTGLDATTNDDVCGGGAATSYAWYGAVFPTGSINFTGSNPTSFGITAVKTFCGVAHRYYIKYCDGVPTDTPTVFFYVSCGNAVADIFGALDTLFTGNVEQNDDICTNGGSTTWHPLADSTAHGTGLNIPIYECFANCPTATPIVGGKIIAWDTLTGVFTVDLPAGFDGEVCFKYRLKCKLSGTKNYDTACVYITRELNPVMTLKTAVLDTTVSDVTVTLSAKCLDGFGNAKPLENGDKINLRMQTAQGNIGVQLIVGQNIRSGSGYVNDTAGRYASWLIPAMSPSVVILDRNALFDSTMTFKINKALFSQLSNNWGDGTVSGAKIGQELYLYTNICCTSCGQGAGGAFDTIPKMWSLIDLDQWNEKANYNSCGNNDSHLRSLIGQTSWLNVPAGAANTFYANHAFRCDTTSAFTNSGVTGELFSSNYWRSVTSCNTCNNGANTVFAEYKTDYITSATYYLNLTVEPLHTDLQASVQRHTSNAVNGNQSVRLHCSFQKHHHTTGASLSVLNPSARWLSTYNNNVGARENGVTITQIEMRVAKDHGDRGYITAQSDRVYLLTGGGIVQANSTTSNIVPGSSNSWNFANGEGYYHHWGYMLASNGKRYAISNGQVIVFSY